MEPLCIPNLCRQFKLFSDESDTEAEHPHCKLLPGCTPGPPVIYVSLLILQAQLGICCGNDAIDFAINVFNTEANFKGPTQIKSSRISIEGATQVTKLTYHRADDGSDTPLNRRT